METTRRNIRYEVWSAGPGSVYLYTEIRSIADSLRAQYPLFCPYEQAGREFGWQFKVPATKLTFLARRIPGLEQLEQAHIEIKGLTDADWRLVQPQGDNDLDPGDQPPFGPRLPRSPESSVERAHSPKPPSTTPETTNRGSGRVAMRHPTGECAGMSESDSERVGIPHAAGDCTQGIQEELLFETTPRPGNDPLKGGENPHHRGRATDASE